MDPASPGPSPFAVPKGDPKAVAATAVKWRTRARKDADYRKSLIGLVLDEKADADSRELAAFVLGTLPDRDGLDALTGALSAARDLRWIRALLLALGCDRTSGDDDDIFSLPDSPRVLAIPIGLSVRVRGTIEERDIRDRMSPHVRSESSGVRWAAAVALADSVDFTDVRSVFLESLPAEREPAAQGELSKALSDWGDGQSGESPERQQVFKALLEGADREDAAALRLRSEEGLKRMPLGSVDVRLMAGRVEAGSLDQKRWAIAVLAGAAGRPNLPDRELVFDALARATFVAPEAKVRELAVTGLSSFGDPSRLSGILVQSLGDPAWHVRAAAARGMGRAGATPESIAALKKAEKDDPDERVRRIAGEVRRKLDR